jgi:serralysin
MHGRRRPVATRSSPRALAATAVIAAAVLSAVARAGGVSPDPLEITFPYAPPVPSAGAPHPLSSIPAYDSFPGAHAKVFLEFAGEQNYDWNGYTPGVTPAYDVDGDPTTFSDLELANIHEIWQRVSEKYSPFNVDVTTADPGNLNHLETTKIVIGGDGKNGQSTYWAGGRYGGIAWPGSFSNALPNTSYVFSGNLANGTVKYVAEASAHEAGHTFGLQHQSVWNGPTKVAEYNPGTALSAPIMGRSYDAARGVWWEGTSIYYTQIQNDLTIASTTNAFGFRHDDHGDLASPDPLSVDADHLASAAGVIQWPFDRDAFSFTTTGGLAQLTVTPFSPGGMLDASLFLYRADGTLVASSATASFDETVAAFLPAGNYDLVVASAGQMGDLGQYTIEGTTVPEPAVIGVAVLLLGMVPRRSQRGAR